MKSTKNKTWKIWIGFGLLLLLGGTACKAYPPAPASQAQVAAGAERYLYVTPATLYYMRTNGLLGGTNNFNYFYPVDATVTNTTTLPAGSNATVTVTGSSNLVFSFGIPAGRDGTATNTINITNTADVVTNGAYASASSVVMSAMVSAAEGSDKTNKGFWMTPGLLTFKNPYTNGPVSDAILGLNSGGGENGILILRSATGAKVQLYVGMGTFDSNVTARAFADVYGAVPASTNIQTVVLPNSAAAATVDFNAKELTITGNLTFTDAINTPAAGYTVYLGASVHGIATIDFPSVWSPNNTNHPVTLTNGLVAFKADGTNVTISTYQP